MKSNILALHNDITDLQPAELPSPEHKGREKWQVGIVGLPDSGKSTFLARLYGSLLGDGNDDASRFSLSFPTAIEEGERYRALADIQKLWEHITRNYDLKLKTVEISNFHFNISGQGLETGLAVETRDLPGETFKTHYDGEFAGLDHESIKHSQKEFRKHYPHMHAGLILADIHKIDDPETIGLIKGYLDFLPRRSIAREPFFKIVVFTKAASPQMNNSLTSSGGSVVAGHIVLNEGLPEKLSALRNEWRKQGYKWVEVVACESLADLGQITADDGQRRYELPQRSEDGSKQLPEWVDSPYSVMLGLARMLVNYRTRRLWTRRLAAVATLLALLSLWCAWGRLCDTHDYLEATSVERVSTETLKTYLLTSPARWQSLFYPLRHHKETAKQKWNEYFFSEDPHMTPLPCNDYEEQLRLLNVLERDRIRRYVDNDKLQGKRVSLKNCMGNLEKQYDERQKEWRDSVLQHADPQDRIERFLVDDFNLMPSIIKKHHEEMSRLQNLLIAEREEVDSFDSLVSKWESDIDPLIVKLRKLATISPPSFRVLREKHAGDVRNLAERIENIGIEHSPYQSQRLIEALITMVNSISKNQAFTMPLPDIEKLEKIRTQIKDKLNCIEKINTLKLKDLEKTDKWEDKLKICRDTALDMKDTPAKEQWDVRSEIWQKKLNKSQELWADCNKKVNYINKFPHKAIELLNNFKDEPADIHATEHRQKAIEESKRLNDEIDDITNRSRGFEERLNKEERWADRIRICEEAKESILKEPWNGQWVKKHQEWKSDLYESHKRWDICRSEVKSNTAKPEEQLNLLKGYKDDETNSPEHREEAKAEINKLESTIKHINEAWQAILNAENKFKLDKKTLKSLEKEVSTYKNILANDGRTTIDSHADSLLRIERSMQAERTFVEEILKEYGAELPKMSGGTSNQRVHAYKKMADCMSRLMDTYEVDGNANRILAWHAGIFSRADMVLASKIVAPDSDFSEALTLLKLVVEYENRLDLGKGIVEKARKMDEEICSAWADTRWSKKKNEVEELSKQGKFKDACILLGEYIRINESPYEIRTQDAEKERQVYIKKWGHKAEEDINKISIRRLEARENYDIWFNDIQTIKDDFDGVVQIPSNIAEAIRKAKEKLKMDLLSWHKDRVNDIITKSPKNAEKRVLDSWKRVDDMKRLLTELAEDTAFDNLFEMDKAKAKKIIAHLDRLNKPIKFQIGIRNITINVDNTLDYWGSNYPKPEMYFWVNRSTTPFWMFTFENNADDVTRLDMKNRLRTYHVYKTENEYIIHADNWDSSAEKRDLITIYPKDNLYIEFNVYKQVHNKLVMDIIREFQTPGALLCDETLSREVNGTISVPDKGTANMRINAVFSVYSRDQLQQFLIPSSFDAWPN